MPNQSANFRHNVAALASGYGEVSRLASYVGVSRVYMSRVIHGHVVPQLDVAERIAAYLGFDLSDLLESPKIFSENHPDTVARL